MRVTAEEINPSAVTLNGGIGTIASFTVIPGLATGYPHAYKNFAVSC